MRRFNLVWKSNISSIAISVFFLFVLQLSCETVLASLYCEGRESLVSDFSKNLSGKGSGCEIVTKKRNSAFAADAGSLKFARLGANGTLSGVFGRLGLSSVEKKEVFSLLEGNVDATRLSAKTGVGVWREAAGMLRGICIRAERDLFWRFILPISDADAGRIERVPLPATRQTERFEGVVKSSLRQAFSGSAYGSELTRKTVDIFKWKIDFNADLRRGDKICVVYEVSRLGELPDDLPPFGSSSDEEGSLLEIGPVFAVHYQGETLAATAFRVEDSNGIANYYDESGLPLGKAFLGNPVPNSILTSAFAHARINPVTGEEMPHLGVDFGSPEGSPIMAAADGIVDSVGWLGQLGKCVKINHGIGYETVYAHLQGYAGGIETGTKVIQGQIIGFVGSTGRATGPHLHYAMVHNGSYVDPNGLKNPPGKPISKQMRPMLERARQLLTPSLAALSFQPPL